MLAMTDFAGVVDLHDEPLIAGERRLLGEPEDLAGPDPRPLPEHQLRKRPRRRHRWNTVWGGGDGIGTRYSVQGTEYGSETEAKARLKGTQH
jgi:hypothetical protein